jgi:hypothetical protein
MTQLFSSQLFSEVWMVALKQEWNNSPEVYLPLQAAEFTAHIGYGFKGEPFAIGMLSVVNGRVQYAGGVIDADLDWDLRASRGHWAEWIKSGFGITRLGPAVATNSLEFVKGNYRQMISNLSLGQPFMRHFQLMKNIKIARNSGAAS